ncbi:Uncharacterised protein (plasmid) [Mesomycoplasma conjunctivae]|nr:Uncharacterised protein [Mycoplasmopsis fermentans]VEU67039.1 Uncharacterised protein [Mesomycoplasma conjunctivae]
MFLISFANLSCLFLTSKTIFFASLFKSAFVSSLVGLPVVPPLSLPTQLPATKAKGNVLNEDRIWYEPQKLDFLIMFGLIPVLDRTKSF